MRKTRGHRLVNSSPGDSLIGFMMAITILGLPIMAFVPVKLAIIMLVVHVCCTVGTTICMIFDDRLWLVRIIGWLLGRKVIELHCYDSTKSIYTMCFKTLNEHGQIHAPVHWFSNVGDVVLLPNGGIDSDHSHSIYIKSWLPATYNDRVVHILTWGPPE